MLNQIISNAGYLVAATRDGKPVLAEGYSAHTDTPTEASQVADALGEAGETVAVFALEQVEPEPPFVPVSAREVASVHPLPDLGAGSPAGDSGTTDRGTVGTDAPVKSGSCKTCQIPGAPAHEPSPRCHYPVEHRRPHCTCGACF